MKTKIARTICGIIAALSFCIMLGIAGSMDFGTIELLPGSIGLVISVTAFGVFTKLSGAMRGE